MSGTPRPPSEAPDLAATQTVATSLVTLLAHAGRAGDLTAHLHQHALAVTGGRCSLLFRLNPRNGLLHPTSASGLEALGPEPWTPEANEAMLFDAAFDASVTLPVADAGRLMPELAARLESPGALLIPLVRGEERVGLLAIGFADGVEARTDPEIQTIADAFITSLELFRLRQRDDLQRDLVSLLEDVSSGLSSTLN